MNFQMESSWSQVLKDEFEKPYFHQLKARLKKEKADRKVILPPEPMIFNAFSMTPFDKVKVVILGQDPYHRVGQAMGLSFSVPKGIRTPPSLKNIYKELHQDIDFEIPAHGDLSHWAAQGVFLLNAFLTVEEGKAGAHQKIGWQSFTDVVIQTLSEKRTGIIFLLWGRFAQAKSTLIDASKHRVLTAFHPSPLARNRFSGCNHFSKVNKILTKNGQDIIDWQN